MDTDTKLKILADAAKYDVACTSSGVTRGGKKGSIGSASPAGCCHSFSADGRCITLLKVLLSNACTYNCAYCINRCSNDVPRATFSPRELAALTIQFYRRNYIEGLFISSAVIGSADYTTERMIECLRILREEYHFRGYIHAKAIPGANERLLVRLGYLADRMSVNIELPSEKSLKLLAPNKTKADILAPMHQLREHIKENREDLIRFNSTPDFVPAGQSTQMIIGATPETDYNILLLAEGLYKRYSLKRVFFSAYIPVVENRNLPSLLTKPPLLREHRLYQADWLLRFYGFSASELLDEQHQNFNALIDPKCNWALNNPGFFPVEVNSADYEELLRVPGIGVKSARRIIAARRATSLKFEDLKKLGIVMKRAQFFITCAGKAMSGLSLRREYVMSCLVSADAAKRMALPEMEQLSLFSGEEYIKCLTGQM